MLGKDGDAAVTHFSQAFDGAQLLLSNCECQLMRLRQPGGVSRELRDALTAMVTQVTAYQEKLLPRDWFENGLGAKFTAPSGLVLTSLVAQAVHCCVPVS